MTDVLNALEAAVRDAAEKVGPSVVGLGRGWGRGSGVVVAPGQVLTVAHVLRGDEVAVTFADGDVREGRVLGADPDLDVAVIGVETGDVPVVGWEPGEVPAGGRGRVRARQPRRAWAADDVRDGVRDRARFPRPARAAGRRLDRAHRTATARELGRPAGGRAREPAGPQRRPPRRRASSSRCRPTRPSSAGSTSWPVARRPSGRGSGSRSPRRAWRGACVRRSGSSRATGSSSARWSTTARRRAPVCSAAICSSAPVTSRSRAWMTCSTRSTARPTAWPLGSYVARRNATSRFR